MDVLQKTFSGGNPDNYQQRFQQYQTGFGNNNFDDLDDDDVTDRYQRTVQNAPPDVLAQAHEEAFRQLPPEQRQAIVDRLRQVSNDPQQPFNYGFDGGPQDYDPRRMGQMAAQAQRRQPDLLSQILGPGGLMGNPLAKMAMAGVTAYAAQKIMGGGPFGGSRGGGLIR